MPGRIKHIVCQPEPQSAAQIAHATVRLASEAVKHLHTGICEVVHATVSLASVPGRRFTHTLCHVTHAEMMLD